MQPINNSNKYTVTRQDTNVVKMRTAIFSRKALLGCVTLLLLFLICKQNLGSQSERGLVANIAVEQAAVIGVDYRKALAGASAGDPAALAEIFKATPCLDGAGATFNSSRLKQLLDVFGDRRFAQILARTSQKTRRSVTSALDFYFTVHEQRRNWFREYPRTFQLRRKGSQGVRAKY